MDAENMETWTVYEWIAYANSVGHHLRWEEVEALCNAVEDALGAKEEATGAQS